MKQIIFNALKPNCKSLILWHTEYINVLLVSLNQWYMHGQGRNQKAFYMYMYLFKVKAKTRDSTLLGPSYSWSEVMHDSPS